MNGWKRICCPVDFSAVSHFAMGEAAELAARSASTLTLLHVEEPLPAPSPDSTLVSSELLRRTALETERQLEAWREQAARVAKVPVECVTKGGDPATEIVRLATEGDYDVVVMGTHGRTGRDRRPFGSVAQKVILDAPCPVLVVRPRAPRADRRGA